MTADGTRLGSTAMKASAGFRTLGSVLLAHLCRHVTALALRVCELHDPPVVPLLHELEGIDAAVRPLGAVVKDVRHPGAHERPVHPNLNVSDALVSYLPSWGCPTASTNASRSVLVTVLVSLGPRAV